VSILLMMAGCVTYIEKRQMEVPLARASEYMAIGDFQAALAENDKVFKRASHTLGAHALIQRGLIYSHPQNPNRDYQKSIEYFQEVTKEFPDSDLIDQAEVLTLTLHKIINMENELNSLHDKIGLMETTIKEKRRAVNYFQATMKKQRVHIKTLKTQINELKGQIEKLKNIDLQIEEEKRKSAPQ